MVNQRSKSGCWTCRLRRKKCPEDGMPCSNCESRGVTCHGYGPRPAWKDRGEREMEEVDRLQLRRRSHTRGQAGQRTEPARNPDHHNLNSQDSGNACVSPAVVFASPREAMLQLSPPPSTREQASEASDFSALLDLHPSLSSLTTPSALSDFWVDGMEGLLDSTPVLFESSAATFQCQVDGGHGDAGEDNSHALTTRTLASPPIHISALQEREIELMMQFLGEDFSKIYPYYRSSSMTDNAWLMWLLQRCPTFFYAALSTTAYLKFLKTPSHDGRRTEYFREYDRFRNRAIELYCKLLVVSSDGCAPSVDWVAQETLISGVQLAMLELLNENFDATLTYLNSASDALAKFSEDHWYVDGLSQVKPASNQQPSGMKHKAVEFFTAILIWVHILHCLSCQSIPAAASLYRRILSTSLGETFFHVVGLEGWAHVALIDAINTAIWKRDQDMKKMLSMRELVGKSEAILSTIEHQIQGVKDTKTRIYAYGVAIYIHTITSGCRPAVPEIQDALEKSVPLWQNMSFRHGELRYMSWAFCVSASLATGEHRCAFTNILSEAATAEPYSTTVAYLKALSEECWNILDTGSADCNWETVMHNLKRSIHALFI